MPTDSGTITKERRSALRKQLLELLGRRPLEPFRIHLKDGRLFDVRYPNMTMVLSTFMSIGIPEPNEPDPFAERREYVDLDEVRDVEMLPQTR